MSEQVFKYFREICSIPHGSCNMEKIADYCVNFADSLGLKSVRDTANNVIIYKKGSKGYENSSPVILQGHLDMVCQKTADSEIDFLNDKIEVYTDGDYLKAKNTTLGGDNGIAVSMIMAILADNNLSHPPIEAVFTTDEEIGMIGASQLEFSLLSAKKMINLDSEEEDVVTVSCAGGSDFTACIPIVRESKRGINVTVTLDGLKGGHSGVEINKGRVNADILMGRFLNHLAGTCDFEIISINGGNKGNAIPNRCVADLVVQNPDSFKAEAQEYLNVIKNEISARENNFSFLLKINSDGEYPVIASDAKQSIISAIYTVPNGIIEMSAEIDGLVETSLNLGILQTETDRILLNFALRSNKQSALNALEDRLTAFFAFIDSQISVSGHYPPWEYKENSDLRELYIKNYKSVFGKEVRVEAIHAGLECGIFSANIPDLDCIAIGPDLSDVHTVNEKLSISSTIRIFNLILKILQESK